MAGFWSNDCKENFKGTDVRYPTPTTLVRICGSVEGVTWQKPLTKRSNMPVYVFRIQVAPDVESELKEIIAPDFVAAVQALAAWCPGVHILKLEGICTTPAAVA